MKNIICITFLNLVIGGFACAHIGNQIPDGPGNPIWHVDALNKWDEDLK